MAIEIRRTAPPAVWGAAVQEEARSWHREAFPFLAYSLSLSFVAQAGVIALDRLQPSAVAVGAYAAAAGTANLVVVLATATNRFYSPRLSILLERRDFTAILRLRRERLGWMFPAVALFLAAVFGFGREILALFRPEFVDEGLAALRILATAAAFSVLFALAPTYLKYVQRNRLVLRTASGAAAAQVVLLVLLVPRFGASGAAIAYAACMCGMYGVFWRVAVREVVRLRVGGGASEIVDTDEARAS
jgi:O-antigen/teichoic acid export membrane protein